MTRRTVLVHGWGFNARIWDDVVTQLRGETLAVNLPGYGGRAGCADGTLDAYAQDFIAQLDGPADWIGWSLGGLVTLRAADLAPQLCRTLTLCASNPRFTATPGWPGVAAPVLAAFAEQLEADVARTVARFIQLQTGNGCDRACVRRLRARLAALPAATPEALRQGLALLRDADLRSALDGLAMPVRWLLGERDTLVPSALAARLRADHPRHHIILLERAGHAPFLDQPALFGGWPA